MSDDRGTAPRDSVQFESWIDAQIREATDRGQFDDLPGYGKPIPGLDKPHDPDRWIAELMERERLKGADLTAALPTSLALRRRREQLQETLAHISSEAAARATIEELNAMLRAALRTPVSGPPIYTATVDVDAELATWRQRRRR